MNADPVQLISSLKRHGDVAYLCDACAATQLLPEELPTGGLPCMHCGAPIGVTQVIHYAPLSVRLLALIIDVSFALAINVSFLIVFASYSGYLPTEPDGDITFRARVIVTAIEIAITALYFLAGDVLGQSIGKRALTIRIVRASTWSRPGIFQGFLRFAAKVITIATPGLGYLATAVDSERRALYDRLSGARVTYA
jgi:uncharacterized RDD family membrane protein YckC